MPLLALLLMAAADGGETSPRCQALVAAQSGAEIELRDAALTLERRERLLADIEARRAEMASLECAPPLSWETRQDELEPRPGARIQRKPPSSGTWATTEGDLVLFVAVDSKAMGRYGPDEGLISGEFSDGVLRGHWAEGSSKRRCPTERLGSRYWGRIHWVFTGDAFDGAWGYCDEEPTRGGWNGQRTGVTP